MSSSTDYERVEEAIRYIATRASEQPSLDEIAAHLGEVLWSLDQKEQARAVWQSGLVQNPDNDTLLDTIKRLHDGAIGDITAMRCYWNGDGVWTRARKDYEAKAGRPLTEMEYQMRNWYYFVS